MSLATVEDVQEQTEEEAEGQGSRPRHRLTPPPPRECVRILRAKYPEALVCTKCGLLLATKAESYAKSNLTEAERLAYSCHECRLEVAEASKAAQTRRENLVAASAAQAARRLAGGDAGDSTGSLVTPAADPHQSVVFSGLKRRDRANRRAYDPARDGGKGRPPVPLSEQRQKARARDRAYRSRKTARTGDAA